MAIKLRCFRDLEWSDPKKLPRFDFRALRPVFDIHPFSICGRPDGERVALWARDHEGRLTTEASAVLA